MASIASLVNPSSGMSPPALSQPSLPPSQVYQLAATQASTPPANTSNGTPRDLQMGSEEDVGNGEDDEGYQEGVYDEDEDDVEGEEALHEAEVDGEDDEDEEEDDDEEEDEESDDDDDDAQSEDLEGDGPQGDAPLDQAEDKPKEAAEPSGEPTTGEEVVHKPAVKKKRARAPSIDEMPPPPPPMKTIRVDREFDDEDTLEWNILDDAREKGMVAEWPPIVELAIPPESEQPIAGPSQPTPTGIMDPNMMDDDALAIAARLEAKYGGPPKKRKAKKEDYDLGDTFIDDSELAIDAPTHIGRTKKEGFFIQQGPVELVMEDPTLKRAPPRRSKAVAAQPRIPTLLERVLAKRKRRGINGDGSASSPIALDDDLSPAEDIPPLDNSPDMTSPQEHFTIDRSTYHFASHDPLLLPPFPTFPAGLAHELVKLRKMSEAWTWKASEKGKFPEKIKPQVVNVARAAWENDWWATFPPKDDSHWKSLQFALPSCLPYNKLTLTKLMVTNCNALYKSFLAECEEVGMEALKVAANEALPDFIAKRDAQKAEYQAQLEAWEATRAQDGPKLGIETPVSVPGSPQVDLEGAAPPSDGRPQPKRSLQLPLHIRDIYIQLLENNYQEYEFAQYGNSLSHSIASLNEKEHRKALYVKVMAALPKDMEITEKSLSTIMSRWKLRRGAGENTVLPGQG